MQPKKVQKTEAMLALIREFFNRCSAIKFLETQQELVSSYVLMEQERAANDMGKFPNILADELHRSTEQSLFLLRLERIFEEIER